jgi:non-ribosomal peptide synthetase component E (peptide arylation enzyme)
MTSLADLFASAFDRPKAWPAPARRSEKSIAELASELVGNAGEASGLLSAAAIMASYSSHDDAGRRLIVVPELPRTAMAKVQKKILRKQFKDIAHAV